MAANLMTLYRALFLLVCALPAAGASEILQDPTRPPAEIGAGASPVFRHSSPTMKGLLSVIISPSRCAAIIDGKTIKLGEKYGNATLFEITPTGVLLHGTNGVRSMNLFPAVGVKPVNQHVAQQSVVCKLANYKIEKKVTHQNGLKEKK